jgi:hypothetical protein
MRGATAALARLAVVAGVGALGACGSGSSGDAGPVGNLLVYGTTGVPERGPPTAAGAAYPADLPLSDTLRHCPSVDVSDGGAALRAVSGGSTEAGAVRNQISIGQLARECVPQADGSVLVKVGVETRVLLGPGGGSGRFSTPVRFTVKRAGTVFASRVQQAAIAVPAGETQGSTLVVQEGLLVPSEAKNDFEIEVGLGGPGPVGRRGR